MKKKSSNMSVSEAGRLGGIARGEGLRSGEIEVSGAAVPKPTVCPRCGKEQPSARAAWVHCRKPRVKKAVVEKKQREANAKK
jgi:hypothetical protein